MLLAWLAVLLCAGIVCGWAPAARATALAGTELAPPDNAAETATGSSPATVLSNFPTGVACGDDGDCVAVGSVDLQVASGNKPQLPQADIETTGTWAQGTTLPLPTDGAGTVSYVPTGSLNAVACPAAGECLAVGAYDTNPAQDGNCPQDGEENILAESLSASGWTASEQRDPLDSASDNCRDAVAEQVACAGAAWCTALGYAYHTSDGSSEPQMWMGAGDVSGLGSSGVVTGPYSSHTQAGQIACASTVSLCLATGIDTADPDDIAAPNFLLVGTDGSWSGARDIPTPNTGDTDAMLDAVACSPTMCYGSGVFTDADGDTRGLIVSTDGSGTWSETSPVGDELRDLSCGGSGCVAIDVVCSDGSPACSIIDYSNQTGTWAPISGAGLGSVAFRCPASGPCYGRDTGSGVYVLSGGVSTSLGTVAMPADCASESSSGTTACGSNEYPAWGCATTTCVEVQPYVTTGGDAAAAAFTLQTPTTTNPSSIQPKITVTCTPNPATAGATVTCTVTVANPTAGSTTTPSGTVQIGTGSASDPSCTLATTGAGQASCSVSFATGATGSATISARYGGDAQFAAGTASTTETVSPAGGDSGSGPGTTGTGTGTGGSGTTSTTGGGTSGTSSTSTSAGTSPTARVSGISASGTTATLTVTCPKGAGACALTALMTVARSRAHAVRARVSATRTVVAGTARTTVRAGHKAKLRVKLNRAGKHLLATRHTLRVKITVTERLSRGGSKRLVTRTLTFHARH